MPYRWSRNPFYLKDALPTENKIQYCGDIFPLHRINSLLMIVFLPDFLHLRGIEEAGMKF
jgi:hypothetical protein